MSASERGRQDARPRAFGLPVRAVLRPPDEWFAQHSLPAGAPAEPADVAVDPSGKYAYVASVSHIAQYIIGSDGNLNRMSIPVVPAAGVIAITIDPSGKYVYASGPGGDISQYTIGAAGGLVSLPLWLRQKTAAAKEGKIPPTDVNCIYIWTHGGTSHRLQARGQPEVSWDLAVGLLVLRIVMQRCFSVLATKPASRWSASLHCFPDRE